MIDKRSSKRIPVSVKVKVKTKTESRSDQEPTPDEVLFITENLSVGGFHLNMLNPFRMGDILKTEISLPGIDNMIRANCEVVWRQAGQGCGLKFLYIPKSHLVLIKSFLAQV